MIPKILIFYLKPILSIFSFVLRVTLYKKFLIRSWSNSLTDCVITCSPCQTVRSKFSKTKPMKKQRYYSLLTFSVNMIPKSACAENRVG